MAHFTTIAHRNELFPGECKVVKVRNRELALYNVEGSFFATTNFCSHRRGPLGDGFLNGTTVTCPWHGWQFDVTTGECERTPQMNVESFEVHVAGEKIQVKI